MSRHKQIQKVTGAKKEGILTEQQRKNLKDSTISKELIRKYHRGLNKTFPELFKDIEIIRTSKHLEGWRSYHGTYNPIWYYHAESLPNIFFNFKKMYVECLMSFKKENQRYFWLDRRYSFSKPSKIDSRHLNKNNIFRKLRYDYSSDMKILERAFVLEIIPDKRKNANSLKGLHSKVKEGKTQQPLTHIQMRKNLTKYQKFREEIKPEWVTITKIAQKYGYKLFKLPVNEGKQEKITKE